MLQGGIQRSLAANSSQDQTDALRMGLALMEIHLLRRNWSQAVDIASEFTPVVSNSNDGSMADKTDLQNAFFRLAAAATVAQVFFSIQMCVMSTLDINNNDQPCRGTNCYSPITHSHQAYLSLKPGIHNTTSI